MEDGGWGMRTGRSGEIEGGGGDRRQSFFEGHEGEDLHDAGAAGLFGGFGGDTRPAVELVFAFGVDDAAGGREGDEGGGSQLGKLLDHPVGAGGFGNGGGD